MGGQARCPTVNTVEYSKDKLQTCLSQRDGPAATVSADHGTATGADVSVTKQKAGRQATCE
jgi:hypothetical protein